MRYAWDMQHEYTKYQGKLVRNVWALMANYVRMWDLSTAFRVDYFVANSKHVARRIKKYYGKDAAVIYPPVDIDRFKPSDTVEDYYVVLSRFAPYKRVDVVIEAFNRLGMRLLVIGTGEQESELKKLAGKNIEFLGHVPDEGVAEYLSRARGSVIAAEEDFGITTVEGIAAGRPVVAYGVGGSTEIIEDGVNGVLFDEPTPDSLAEAVRRAEAASWDAGAIRETSLRFGADVFRREMKSFVEASLEEHAR
jgi:glycosyltransferase involved in cell wall biosynthesis